MFDWLKKKTPPAQAQDRTHSLSAVEAQTIVYAFIDVMAEGAPYIGDANTLAYPTDLIRRAFVKHIEHYELMERTSGETFRRLGHDEDLRLLRRMSLRVDTWHYIDTEDELSVARLNTHKGPPPDWAFDLMAKYHQRREEE